MKIVIIALAAALSVSACATDRYYNGGGRIAYNGYYDGFYGPVHDGYWDDGGVFFYRTGRGGEFIRDGDGHFRRDWDGRDTRFHQFHMNGPRNWHRRT